MEIKLAESAGFCFGVKRAVDKVKRGRLFTHMVRLFIMKKW